MKPGYVPALDWMKAIGIVLVVHGHVAARTAEWLTPPFYPKQVGVAMFVFATGFTLARERRPTAEALFNRLFEIMVVCLAAALMMSAVTLGISGDAAESNYLPLVGLHVLLPDLPANPTTWYVGTYLHLLLVWAFLLRDRPLTWRHWGVLFVVGIAVRVGLIQVAGPHRAYMAIFNWLDVLVMGLLAGRVDSGQPRWTAFAVLLPLIWPLIVGRADWEPAFPFMIYRDASRLVGLLVLSVAVSFGYTAYTWTAWSLTQRLPAPASIRFLARNTVLVFVAHMPVYYLLEHALKARVPDYATRVAIEMVVCLIGLAVVSELLHRAISLTAARSAVSRIVGFAPGA